jgi:hypothetical protein
VSHVSDQEDDAAHCGEILAPQTARSGVTTEVMRVEARAEEKQQENTNSIV